MCRCPFCLKREYENEYVSEWAFGLAYSLASVAARSYLSDCHYRYKSRRSASPGRQTDTTKTELSHDDNYHRGTTQEQLRDHLNVIRLVAFSNFSDVFSALLMFVCPVLPLPPYTDYLLPKYHVSRITIITMWQAARGAEAHQCWPPIVTNSTDIINV